MGRWQRAALFASSLFDDADLPTESPSTQNRYLDSVLRWRSVLVPKNTVHNTFLRLGIPLETV